MDNSKTTRKKRRRVTVFRAIMALLLVAGIAFAIFRLTLRSRLNVRIEAIRAAGYPVTLAELDEWYSIAEGAENAADTITSSFSYYVDAQNLRLLPFGRAGLPARTEPLSAVTKAVLIKHIADNKEALKLLHAGAAIEHCRYSVDFTAGNNAQFPHFARLRKGVWLLNLEAILYADTEPRLSVRSIVSSIKLARSVEKEPVLVSQLVRIACQALAVSTLEHLVNRTDLTDEQLGELSQAVVVSQAPPALSQSFIGERCMTLATLAKPSTLASHVLTGSHGSAPTSGLEFHLTTFSLALHRFAGLTDRSTLTYLDLIEDYLETAQLPEDRRHRAIETIGARCDAVSRTDSVLDHIVPPIARVERQNLGVISLLRAAQTALAIQRYRLAAGKLPDALPDLVPTYLDTVPRDPFDGKDLRYARLQAGYVVYSIGENLRDDGGTERPPGSRTTGKSANWDITFTVER